MSYQQKFSCKVIPDFLATGSGLSRPQTINPTNKRKTTRFTLFSFLPMTLMYQFKRVPIIVFSICCILQFIPAIATSKQPAINSLTLGLLIFFGILREFKVEMRYRAEDQIINRKVYKKLRSNLATVHEPTIDDESRLNR